ncbi:MAG: SBBP repeat-containing protein [Deltaproteobacteria bacterium]|nr:SBBP repeat-containing protein [Deltaproteobacteria bacterium]
MGAPLGDILVTDLDANPGADIKASTDTDTDTGTDTDTDTDTVCDASEPSRDASSDLNANADTTKDTQPADLTADTTKDTQPADLTVDITARDAPEVSLTLEWSKSFGSSGADIAWAVVVDSMDNSTITGNLDGLASFGGSDLDPIAPMALFLASYSAHGVHRWSKCFGQQGSNGGRALTVDAGNNVFVCGDFEGSASFGGSTLTSVDQDDLVVASFTDGGVHRWSQGYGDTGDDGCLDLTRDRVTGHLFVAGRFTGTSSFGGPPLQSKGGWDALTLSLTSTGQHRWSQRFGGLGDDASNGLTVGPLGFVTVASGFNGTDSLDGNTITSSSDDALLPRSALEDGAYGGHKQLGGLGSDVSRAIAADAAGNIYIVGDFSLSVSFGNTATHTSSGQEDIFIASYTPAGVHRWSKSMGSTNTDRGVALAMDAGGDIYVTGAFQGAVSCGGASLTSAGKIDIILTRINSNGANVWCRQLGGAGDDIPYDVTVSAGGAVYLTGSFTGTTDFGEGPLTSVGREDVFLLKFTQ